MRTEVLVLTCEHGGAQVPVEYRRLFASKAAKSALESHRGCDRGALRLARSLERTLRVPLYASAVTRLLVDLNRSVGHPRLFSEFSKGLDPAERAALLEERYFPHRNAIEWWINTQVRRGHRVVHIGVHSFVPRVKGRMRTADIGILYDPSRSAERAFCDRWKSALRAADPGLRVRRNYPYLGKSDGLVTYLRQVFGPRDYVGIELEANQALLQTSLGQRRAARSLTASLHALAVA
jgi:predicted N-formylglutamate amidohydrolase